MNREIIYRVTFSTEKIINDEGLSAEENAELEAFLAADSKLVTEFERRTDRTFWDIRIGLFLRGKAGWKSKMEADLRKSQVSPTRRWSIPRWRVVTAAAAVLVFLAVGIVLLVSNHKKSEWPAVAAIKDLAPGGNKAILTLADGSSVVLDSAGNGALAQQGSTKVTKLSSGQLAYKAEGHSTSIGFNTVSTPAGGTYQVNLPDGSKVWLNAASSIRFPTAFTGDSREVSITGEAYLDIAKDPLKPFKVIVNQVTTEVLGTSFDIMAYKDGPVKTTLVDGSVRVKRGADKVILRPGQQAQVQAGPIKVVPDADIEAVTAWKEGLFIFKHASIEDVMEEFARWYDVEVQYEGPRTSRRISGFMRRDSYASKNLAILSANGYHFKIQGKSIVVLP